MHGFSGMVQQRAYSIQVHDRTSSRRHNVAGVRTGNCQVLSWSFGLELKPRLVALFQRYFEAHHSLWSVL